MQRLLLWWWPAFEGSGIDLSLVILRAPNEASRSFADAGIPVRYLGRGKFDPRTLSDLTRVVREGRYDVVHTHGYGSTTFGRLAGASAGVPVIVHEHMIDDGIPAYQRLVDRALASRCSKGIAVSQAVARFMIEKRHVPPERVEVVHNTIPEACFRRYSANERAAVAARLGLDLGHRHVGIIGRLHPIKGHDEFLGAARELAGAHDDVRFVVVGDGELAGSLAARARELGIEARVAFLGHQDDVPAVISLLDVLAVPSHSEGFSLTAAEAMAGGCAVVATRVGGIPEVVAHEETGLLVPPRDRVALAAAISELLRDGALRGRLAARGRQVAEERFRITSTVAAFARIYRALGAPKRRARDPHTDTSEARPRPGSLNRY